MKLLGMFAKYWRPGSVKTRLASRIGNQRASELYRAMVEHLSGKLSQVGNERWLVCTPPDSRVAFASLAGDAWRIALQSDGDLGFRMRHFFAEAFASGATHVLLIGTDIPTLPLAVFDEAFAALDSHDVVLGPTDDGGYYLVGAANAVPTIFDDVAWSSPHVWTQTVELLRKERLSWHRLPNWYDVDELADLQRLIDELRKTGEACELLAAAEHAINSDRS